MRKIFLYLYLITIINPYEGIDYDKINVYHIRKKFRKLNIEIIEPESDTYVEDEQYYSQKRDYYENSQPTYYDPVFIPFRFMYD
jgi:hypothetical protein